MLKNLLIAGILLAAFVPTTVGATNNGYDSNKNQPSYWGENCDKTEFNGHNDAFTPGRENVIKVIVKGGGTNKVYDNPPFKDLTANINEKTGKPYAISHVIECLEVEVPAETPETSETPEQEPVAEQPEIKKEVKPAVTPSALPKTGASPALSFIVGAIVSGTAWLLLKKREERLESESKQIDW